MRLTLPVIFAATLFSLSATAQLQKINTIAGTGIGGFGGDGSVSTAATLHAPRDVKYASNGYTYILDYTNYRIRRINPSGNIVTIAGNGVNGNSGDGSVSTSASVWATGIALDNENNLTIADGYHGVIRKINASGIINTIAGIGLGGNSGNGGPATLAAFGLVHGIAYDADNNLYLADATNHIVRRINAAGIISRFAGDDTAGYAGDDGPAITARLDSPYAVAADHKGNVYISDIKANVVRKVNAAGIITTYAGTGTIGHTGDGGLAGAATLNRPAGLAVDATGNLYIADADNDVIRMVDTAGIITTIIGNGTPGFGGDLGYVDGCNLHTPFGVSVAADGSVYIADANNQRIRKTYATVGVTGIPSASAITVYPNPAAATCIVTGAADGDIITVSDIAGRAVSSVVASSAGTGLNVSNLVTGMYFVRVVNKDGNLIAVTKLIRN